LRGEEKQGRTGRPGIGGSGDEIVRYRAALLHNRTIVIYFRRKGAKAQRAVMAAHSVLHVFVSSRLCGENIKHGIGVRGFTPR